MIVVHGLAFTDMRGRTREAVPSGYILPRFAARDAAVSKPEILSSSDISVEYSALLLGSSPSFIADLLCMMILTFI